MFTSILIPMLAIGFSKLNLDGTFSLFQGAPFLGRESFCLNKL